MLRSVRSVADESWPLATGSRSVPPAATSQERTIVLDEPAASPVGKAGEEVTITLTATGATVSMAGREATIVVVPAGEVVLKETIKL